MRMALAKWKSRALVLVVAVGGIIPSQSCAETGDIPSHVHAKVFSLMQTEIPAGWFLANPPSHPLDVSTPTEPANCLFSGLFSGPYQSFVQGPNDSFLLVRILHAPHSLHTIESWAADCAQFITSGGGGVTGTIRKSVLAVPSPFAGALSYRITGQGPFEPEEQEIAGEIRGLLVLVSQFGSARDDFSATEVFQKTTTKIIDWSG